jgi:hypothetical protein
VSKSIAVLGSDQVPLTYTVPVPGTLTTLTAAAVFDGTGAAGSFEPCLSMYDSDGNLIARATAPEVAAGDSAEVSWFPGAGLGQAAAAASGLPWLFAERSPDPSIPDSTWTTIDLNPALPSVIWNGSDTSIMTLADTGDGTFGPSFLADGIYVLDVWTSLEVGVAPALPSSSSMMRWQPNDVNPVDGQLTALFMPEPLVSGPYFAQPALSAIVNIGGFVSAPFTPQLQVIQDTGENTTISFTQMVAYQLNPTGGNNF